ncbi:MAG: VacB/RNase II family 3'-5' exoribonuclease, partial [Deltaproteobacteria bacterium]|nr:VacB/RNase II family 3'-5' exoribonuclease [Deltaproteobacteria bacterium]
MTIEKIDREQVLAVLRSAGRPVVTLESILSRVATRASRSRRLKGTRREVLGQLRRLLENGEIEKVVGGYRMARRDALREGVVDTISDSLHGTVVDDSRRVWDVQSATPLERGRRVLFAPPEVPAEEAIVLDPIDEERSEWVGVLQSARRGARVVPYQDRSPWRVTIAHGDLAGAEDGEVVVAVRSKSRAGSRRGRDDFRGRIVERLGRPGDPEADFRAVAWNHRLRLTFDPEIEAEVEALSEALDPAELRRRVDLRARPFLTIDPASARDHDDAVYVEPVGEQLRLFVAIADVSHYVGSALDREALRRGNSVYFPDRVVPMLPERISGDLCSLRAGRDRFVLTVEMQVGRDGRVLRSSFYPAVIRSRAGLAYEQAAALMEGDTAETSDTDPEIVEQVRLLGRLESRLSKRRFENGSIDFDLSESRVELDSAGRPERIVQQERTRAHRAIEEAMLAANRAVADCMIRSAVGCIYRGHEAPERSDLEALREQLSSFGLLDSAASRGLESGQIHRALERVRGRPEARLVNMLALRTMKQARYFPENQGHFALGFDSYLHFTSPIRRYADLVVHRALAHWFELGGVALDVSLESHSQLTAIARRVSFRERAAVEAERDIVTLKKCAFMSKYVGECFDGIVTGVTSFGLYVTLDEHDVDGLVHRT